MYLSRFNFFDFLYDKHLLGTPGIIACYGGLSCVHRVQGAWVARRFHRRTGLRFHSRGPLALVGFRLRTIWATRMPWWVIYGIDKRIVIFTCRKPRPVINFHFFFFSRHFNERRKTWVGLMSLDINFTSAPHSLHFWPKSRAWISPKV